MMTAETNDPENTRRPGSEPIASEPPGEHPDLESWIAYFQATEASEASEELHDHLSRCRRCVDLVLALDQFDRAARDAAPRDDGAISSFEKAAVWSKIRSANRRDPWRLPLAAAASVLMALFGWSSLQLSQQQTELQGLRGSLVELTAPQANTPIYDLRPGNKQRSLQEPAMVLEVARNAGFTLILNPRKLGEHDQHHLEIHDSAGQLVHRIEQLRRDEFQTFTVMMPPDSLEPGRYTLTLFETSRGREGPEVDSFSIELVRPSGQG